MGFPWGRSRAKHGTNEKPLRTSRSVDEPYALHEEVLLSVLDLPTFSFLGSRVMKDGEKLFYTHFIHAMYNFQRISSSLS